MTVLNQTPSAFRQLSWAAPRAPRAVERDAERPADLRLVIFGGEALEPASLAPWLERFGDRRPELVNMYGITETTVHVTRQVLRRADAQAPGSLIGRPIPDLALHVVDRRGEPVPPGVPGELVVGGAGLALGYLGRAALTAERFVPDPFGPPGARLYRSGDLARRLADGDLDYLGRIDHQVKIRGHRIELGEVEDALARHPAVRESAVAAWPDEDGGRRLAAYVVRDPDWRPAPTGGGAGDVDGAADEGVADDRVTRWREVFDQVYGGAPPRDDPTFDIVGWTAVATGEPIPAAEMREWLDDTVGRLRELRPRRALEIGCGTGMLLYRLAPECEHYTATDLSPVALAGIEAQLAERPWASKVTLLHRAADRFDGLPAEEFDTVILSSVAQYFPSAAYLRAVIEGSLRLLRPGGALFLGDLRSLPLLPVFHAEVELARARPDLSLDALGQRIRARSLREDELLVAPELFAALRRELPGSVRLGRVEILPRRGRARNELTAYRYQAVLHVREEPPVTAADAHGGEDRPHGVDRPDWPDWQGRGWSLDRLAACLRDERPAKIAFSGVPNARTAAAVRAARRIEAGGPLRVAALRREARAGGSRRSLGPGHRLRTGRSARARSARGRGRL